MDNNININRENHDQVVQLIDQLIEFTAHQDSLNRQKEPVENCGQGFLTSKLSLIRKALVNEV